jgi:hypothetical protein
MRLLLALLFLLLPLTAFAASPEDDYIAAREKFIAQFKLNENEPVTDAISKAEEQARATLEKQMQAVIGASGVKGAPAQGKLNLDSLITGDMGFGLLDGVVFKLKGETQVLVTTRGLLTRWLKAEQEIWKTSPQHGPPAEIDAALRAENFYTQAMSHDAAVTRYAEIPVTEPNAYAMLIAHQQDIGPVVPKEMIVAVLRGDRLFVWSAPAAVRTTMIPQCAAIWRKAERDAKAASARKDSPDDAFETIQQEGDAKMRACYGARAKSAAFFPALVKQARDLIERVK